MFPFINANFKGKCLSLRSRVQFLSQRQLMRTYRTRALCMKLSICSLCCTCFPLHLVQVEWPRTKDFPVELVIWPFLLCPWHAWTKCKDKKTIWLFRLSGRGVRLNELILAYPERGLYRSTELISRLRNVKYCGSFMLGTGDFVGLLGQFFFANEKEWHFLERSNSWVTIEVLAWKLSYGKTLVFTD